MPAAGSSDLSHLVIVTALYEEPETVSALFPYWVQCMPHRLLESPLDRVQGHVGRKGRKTPLLASLVGIV